MGIVAGSPQGLSLAFVHQFVGDIVIDDLLSVLCAMQDTTRRITL